MFTPLVLSRPYLGPLMFAALLLVSASPGPARADPLPAGNYQQSCRNMAANGGALTAQCKDRGQNWRDTRLDNFRQCVSEIQNQDGVLRCSRGAPPPRGAYADTCRDIWMEGANLHATCRRRDGNWVGSTLAAVGGCVGNIANQDGVLRCDRGRPAPGGSYTGSCRDIRVEGNTLFATCKNRDGGWTGTTLANVQDCRGVISNQAGVLRCDRGGVAPAGSYQSGCRDIWLDGSRLNASCKTIGGGWVNTTLELTGCNGGISNIDGQLSCARGNAPPGTYRDSCRGITVSATRLTASCRRRDGSYVPASFDLARQCSDGPYNLDGYVTCTKGGKAPLGSYSDSCRDIEIVGAAMTALCRSANGAWVSSSLANVPGCVSDINNNDGKLRCTAAQQPPVAAPQDVEQCCSAAVPGGFILVDRKWNAVKQCGQSTSGSGSTANQCFYRRYDNLPINSRLQVCVSAPTPSGWESLGESSIPTTCAPESDPAHVGNTVKEIKRVK